MTLLVMTVSLSIILINCSEVKLQHTNNSKILFRFQEINTTDFIVEKNKPFDIVLDNYFAKYAWCLNFYYTGPDDVFVKHVTFDGTSDSVIGVPKVKDNMITKWWCVVLQEHNVGKPYCYHGRNYTAQNIVFDLRAKDQQPTFVLTLIYTISAIALAALLIMIITILIRKYCCNQSYDTPLKITIDPDSVFYLNLEIFRRQYYERELQAQEEPQYEEID